MDRLELRRKLPHGAISEVAHEAGVTIMTVSRFFAGQGNSHKVEIAALKIAKRYNDEKKKLERGLK